MFNQIVPVANPQGRRGATARHTVQIINLILWAGLSVSPCLWRGSSPVQASASERGAQQSAQESVSLEPGKTVERELSGSQSHSYKIAMISGQYLQVTVGQQGIDVALALFAPDGKKIIEVDGERVTGGLETISAIAEAPGAYRIEVRSVDKMRQTGRYEIKVDELRDATTEDKYRVAGGALFREAEQLQEGTLEAKRKSIEKYHEALELYRRATDRKREAQVLNSIGAVYWSLGEPQKALEKQNEALPLSRAIGDREVEALILNSIGVNYCSLGEMRKALENHNEALAIFREVGDRQGEADTLSNLGFVYQNLGEMQKALEKLNESLPLRRSLGDRNGEAITLNGIGIIYWLVGETQEALEKYNEALSLKRAVGNRQGEAIQLSNIGVIYGSLGETQKALEKYNEALSLSRAVGDRLVEAKTLSSIGAVYQSLGKPQKALEKYDEALSLSRAVGNRSVEATVMLGIARAEQKRGNLIQARQLIEQAVVSIEPLRTNISSQQLRASYFATQQEFFETYIDVLMQMHKQNPAAAFDAFALAVSERARARSLLELLKEARADIRQGVDGSLLDRERSLQQRLNTRAAAQIRLLNRKHTPEQAEAAAKEIAAITTEYDEIKARIRARSPRYAALTQPQPLGLTEIQQQVLDPDTLLLEYSLGDNASYLFVVSQTSITGHLLPKRVEIEAAARRVREL